MNELILSGNVVRDLELKETTSGKAYCQISIAVQRPYEGKDREPITDFFNFTVWQKTAEFCARYLKKGSKIVLKGNIQNRSYEDKEGYKRTITEIKVDKIETYGRNSNEEIGEEESLETSVNRESRPIRQAEMILDESDLPF